MKTISNREFVANPELYLGIASEQEVRIRKGSQVFSLVLQPDDDEPEELTDDQVWGLFSKHYPDGLPPLGTDEEEIARAITFDELMVGIHEDIDRKWAQRRK